jgi:demethylmenaquinone methyltransferase/2-methoxy-6-polyprenyl-1,4-benzoquinol methylase
MTQRKDQISRVTRSKEVAKASYDRMSRWYDLIAGTSEWKFVKIGLDLLKATDGEVVLDVGHGTGKSVLALARSVGETGRVCGLDLSEGMHRIASDRVDEAGLSERVDLRCGDAVELPFEDGSFDAIFTSFTLELFDTPEIPVVLQECNRVLRSGGRIVVVSMSKKSEESIAVRLYEWAHEKLPNYVDCRPIYVTESLSEAGFEVSEKIEIKMWGLPVDAVLARKV